jgi:hypothetical protein
MKKVDWNTIRQQIGRSGPAPDRMAGSDEFWTDFRARTRFHPQHEAAGVAFMPAALRWAATAAAAAVVVAAAIYALTPGPTPALTEVKSVSVAVPHSAVLIMDNERTHSTILWISGMTAATTQGGGG